MPTHKNLLTIHEMENFKESLLTHIGEFIVREVNPKDSDRASKEAPFNTLWNEDKVRLGEALDKLRNELDPIVRMAGSRL